MFWLQSSRISFDYWKLTVNMLASDDRSLDTAAIHYMEPDCSRDCWSFGSVAVHIEQDCSCGCYGLGLESAAIHYMELEWLPDYRSCGPMVVHYIESDCLCNCWSLLLEPVVIRYMEHECLCLYQSLLESVARQIPLKLCQFMGMSTPWWCIDCVATAASTQTVCMVRL